MDDVTKIPLVSICIPTYNRPHLLRSALESCLIQTYEAFEIIVGDDSKDDRSQVMVKEFQARYAGKIRYLRNIPSLGQAANVNTLFINAAGARLVLLHDDDLLLPDALQNLSDCWVHSPSLAAAFGKQYVVTMKGEILPGESERINEYYDRTPETAGAVMPGLAGIRQMFPNDGYMVLTERARAIGYRPFSKVGDACDFDFALRYCADNVMVWFHNAYTTAYRLSDDGISKTSIVEPFVYHLLSEYEVQAQADMAPEVERALRKAIEQHAPSAVSGYARMGQGLKALRILASSDYLFRDRFRLRFLVNGVLTFSALIGGSSGARVIHAALKWCMSFGKPREISS